MFKRLAYILGIACAFGITFNIPSTRAQGITTALKVRSTGWQSIGLNSGTLSGNPNPEAQANPVKGVTTGTSQPGVTNGVALHLLSCVFYQISAQTASGQTFSQTGSLSIWDWPDQSLNQTAIWNRNKGLDEQFSGVAASQQSVTFMGHQAIGTDWIGVSSSSVGVSGGTTLLVKIDALCAY